MNIHIPIELIHSFFFALGLIILIYAVIATFYFTGFLKSKRHLVAEGTVIYTSHDVHHHKGKVAEYKFSPVRNQCSEHTTKSDSKCRICNISEAVLCSPDKNGFTPNQGDRVKVIGRTNGFGAICDYEFILTNEPA